MTAHAFLPALAAEKLRAELRGILGASHVLTDADALPFLTDQRGQLTGRAVAVVRPANTAEVAQVVALCARHGTPIVPQGGNTGLCGGATPDDSGRAVLLSLARLNRIRSIDTENDSLVAEAGCVLAAVQAAANEAGRLFPLSLGSEGSCTIGGNLGTNAGGTQVLRYGNARQLTLGLEVVTPSGEIWDGLKGLRKDNTGYDLRDLYIGSEGTLGIITAATLRLFPQPAAERTAFVAFPSLPAAVEFLAVARIGLGESLTAFEVISSTCLDLVRRHIPQASFPGDAEERSAPWHALVEIGGSDDESATAQRLERVLANALERGLLRNAVIASSIAQSQALWHLRDALLGEALRRAGGATSHDISVPVSRIPAFIVEAEARLQRLVPGVQIYAFGHLGDGNLHYNALPPAELRSPQTHEQLRRLVHDAAVAQGGSISAEHGLGQVKNKELARYKSTVELQLMRAIKAALDPQGLMNPGKVLPPG
ncbi:FAD-binding oxidoreductase [Rhodovastum atsumiense]|uniref:FAD-binding oxidoreductase n=1 Tax=Rhodovastum atsumiense TaxID=504468 RepID=A0A5M6IL55_9PROT|nr:FAD-binding oxidoreductase [Rhodovastum atsumiense]KAA5608657.1 FAD-binding oxidoreductase [Rhodovastum atsumiense]CAH2598814.1 FAD-binding oxidoreductase [Rhodovastum atsumiense]